MHSLPDQRSSSVMFRFAQHLIGMASRIVEMLPCGQHDKACSMAWRRGKPQPVRSMNVAQLMRVASI
jgi:hypothetical protein